MISNFIITPMDYIMKFQNGNLINSALEIIASVIGGLILKPEKTLLLLSLVEEKLPGSLLLIYEAIDLMAELGSEEAAQAKEVLDEALNLQGETLSLQEEAVATARRGAKLEYIKSLQGYVPEGYEKVYFKCGGKVYSKVVKKDKCGAKMKKCENGNDLTLKKDSISNLISKRAAERLNNLNNTPSKTELLLNKRAAERLKNLEINNKLESKKVFDPTYKRYVTKEKCGGAVSKKKSVKKEACGGKSPKKKCLNGGILNLF